MPNPESRSTIPEKNQQSERLAYLEVCKADCDGLTETVDTVPEAARIWLTNEKNCPIHLIGPTRQAFLNYVERDESLALLTGQDLEAFMSVCLVEASEIAEIDEKIEAEQASNEEKRTTIDVFSSITAAATEQGLTGRAYLDFALSYIQADEIPEAVRQEIEPRLARISGLLDEMLAVTDDPSEQAAIANILDNSTFDLSSDEPYTVFANVVEQIETSDALSETTKAKLKVEVLGIPPLKNATQMLNTLAEVRANNGQFRNADGQIVTLDEKNGVPLGRYDIHPDPSDHDSYLATTMVGGRRLSVPFSPEDDPAYLNELVSALMISQVLANRDFQGANRYILGGDGLAAQGYQGMRLDMEEVARAKRLYGAFMGFGSELRSGFPDPSQMATFERFLQFTHIDGDAKTNDNTGRGDQSWADLGMIDPQSGKLNMKQIERIGGHLQQNYTSPPSFEQLRNQFGDASAPATSESN